MNQEATTDKEKSVVDEALAKGPLSKRGCNDIFCSLLFLFSIVAFFCMGLYGLGHGNPGLLLTGYV